MPLLLAGGVCCVVAAFEEAGGVVDAAGVVDFVVAGAAVGVAAGAEVAVEAGADELLAEDEALEGADFLDLEGFVAAEASPAGVEDAAASVFFVVVDGEEVPEAAAALEVAACLDLEDFLVVEESAAAVPVVSDVLDLEVDFVVVEDASAEVSSADFFFFLDLVVELESDWSVDCEACGLEARRERLPARSSKAASRARDMDLPERVIFEESFRRKGNRHLKSTRACVPQGGTCRGVKHFLHRPSWNGQMMKEKRSEVNRGKNGWEVGQPAATRAENRSRECEGAGIKASATGGKRWRAKAGPTMAGART